MYLAMRPIRVVAPGGSKVVVGRMTAMEVRVEEGATARTIATEVKAEEGAMVKTRTTEDKMTINAHPVVIATVEMTEETIDEMTAAAMGTISSSRVAPTNGLLAADLKAEAETLTTMGSSTLLKAMEALTATATSSLPLSPFSRTATMTMTMLTTIR